MATKVKHLVNNRSAGRLITGRTIYQISLRHFDNGRGGFATDPTITLDDNTWLEFTVEETETGEYGIAVYHYSSDEKRPPRRMVSRKGGK